MKSIVSKKIRNSARGEDCTLRIPGVCNFNPETVVYCHLPSRSKGMGKKGDDHRGCYGCSNCHDVLDGRVWDQDFQDNKWELIFYAHEETETRLIEKGLIKVF